jgi:pilus assembly protein CpaB
MDRRALLIALAASLLGVVLLVLYLKRFERDASGGDKVKILIAVKAMERGKPISEDQLSTHDVPQAYLEPRAVLEREKTKIIGLRLGTTLQAGQTLMWTDLATANEERRDLSTLILPGHVGVSIKTTRDDSSAGMVKPGDYVDVILTMSETTSMNATSDVKSALVILQKVLVLASGYDTSPETADLRAKDARVSEAILTISLSIQEAQLLAVAGQKGTLSVALRNADDSRISPNIPRISSTVLNPDIRVINQLTTTAASSGPSIIVGPPGGGR